MSLVGFKAQNHTQQVKTRGASDAVDDRATTPGVFDPLNARFAFTLDVAASAENTKCERYFTIEDDGLAQSWAGESVWCNPPYSSIGDWVQRAWSEYAATDGIVMLLPANRTEQSWWQDYVEPHRDRLGSPLTVEFIRGRLRFDVPGGYNDPRGNRPPFGSVLLIWSADAEA